jgi:hypothetical protein
MSWHRPVEVDGDDAGAVALRLALDAERAHPVGAVVGGQAELVEGAAGGEPDVGGGHARSPAFAARRTM